MGVRAIVHEDEEIGYFRVYATPPGGQRREITFFRKAPVSVSAVSSQDPFGDSSLQMTLPQVTAWDVLGSGDLDWLVPYSLIDVVWHNTGRGNYKWSFEGYVASMSPSADENGSRYTIDVKGALLLLDNYLAAPEYPQQPIPYEILMRRAFDQDAHPAFLSEMTVEWPTIDGWDKRVPTGTEYEEKYRYAQLRPWGVAQGQTWTGFTTRSTGSWEPLLSGFVQGLLSVMFEEGGHQWTIRKDEGRRPVLYLRDIVGKNDPDLLTIDLGAPGVSVSLSRDFTQSANIIYGAGQDTAGSSYSGANVTPDGLRTFYSPFAHQPAVWPIKGENGARNAYIIPKETHIKFPTGMDLVDAEALARAQMNRFADPGHTGTITLKTDPRDANGVAVPRFLIKAGSGILLRGYMGSEIVFHVTNVAVDFSSEGVITTLTVDSKYRDQMTVSEVQARTRDAMTPLRSLQVGSYSNTISDLLLPWSYAQGSGVVPSGGGKDATEFFTKHLPADAIFPYERYTKMYPPSSDIGNAFYIPMGKVDRGDANNNWAVTSAKLGWPIKMSQSGSSRLVQLAAYHRDGSLAKVRFHASFYLNNGVSVSAMPKLPGAANAVPSGRYLKAEGGDQFKAGQSNPFFETAWEQVQPDGTTFDNFTDVTAEGSDIVVGYGTYYEPAGYWPGRSSRGDAPTGLLVDEVSWSWDMSRDPNFDPQKTAEQQSNLAGYLYVMIYCDYQGDDEIYFMGRIYRQETN